MICFAGLTEVASASVSEMTDASGQWRYVLEKGSATVTGCVRRPPSDLLIPSELDGYPVTSIGKHAFEDQRISSVTIPNSVISIGDCAFLRCSSLTSVTIPDSVKSIGDWAFYNCNLTSITIPESVTSIGRNPFGLGRNPFARHSLTYIDVSPNNPVYVQIDGVLFDKQRKELVSFPSAKGGVYAIPEGTLLIGDHAFSFCSRLTGVTIPESVTSIGIDAFVDCESLTEVTISNNVTIIKEAAFYRCYGLTNVTIGSGVRSIERIAFGECKSLANVTIMDGVTSIDESAFSGCNSLALSVTKDSYAEQYAKDNDIPYILDSDTSWLDTMETNPTIDIHAQFEYVLENGSAIITGFMVEPEGDLLIPSELNGYTVTGIDYDAFQYCGAITSVSIPNSVINIRNSAFAYCSLTSITIPNSVTAIDDWVFFQSGLTSVTIPDSVTSIGAAAFNSCSSLTSVIIPDSVTSIGEYAFERCGNLTLSVAEGSYAEQYAKDNGIAYAFMNDTSWLDN